MDKKKQGTIKDSHAYKQGEIYAEQINTFIDENGEGMTMYDALSYASQAAPKNFSDKYDVGRFVAGVRGYYKQAARWDKDNDE